MTSKKNKYDYALILIIALLAFGNIGGSLQPVRLVSIIASPFLYVSLISHKPDKPTQYVCLLFGSWFLYAVISLAWTTDWTEGMKQLLYYYAHFSLFLCIFLWSGKAIDPLNSILSGWKALVLLTIPVALYEIATNHHLTVNLMNENTQISLGDEVIQKRFASVTFGNYNAYVVVLCYALPFLFSTLLSAAKIKKQLWGWGIILVCFFTLLMNASRGGLLCAGISSLVFFYYYRRLHFPGKKWLIGFITIGVIYVLYRYSADIFSQFLYRIIDNPTLVQDENRSQLITYCWQIYENSFFMGTGIGSIEAALSQMHSKFIIPHNLFLEILTQYGMVILFLFLYLLLKIWKRARLTDSYIVKCLIYGVLFCFPFSSIINSNYLLLPILWAMLGSLYSIVYRVKSIIPHD